MNWVAILVASIGLCASESIAAQDSRKQLCPACVAGDPNRSFETEDVQLDVEAFARALGRRDPLSRHDFFLLLGPESLPLSRCQPLFAANHDNC